MKKKVIVLGGAGYLGCTLCNHLLENSYEVICIDAFWFGEETILPLKSYLGFTSIKYDLQRINELEHYFDEAYAVINLAGIVGDPACNIDAGFTKSCNYEIVKKSASLAKRKGISRYVFASSCSVYGKTTHLKSTETSQACPLSLYAQDKLDSEFLLRSLASKNFHPTILRLSTLFGWSSRMRFDLVVNLLVAQASLGQVLNVFGGSQWRPFLHVKDASRAFEQILSANLDLVSNQIYNLGSDQNNYRIIDITHLIVQLIPAKVVISEKNIDHRDYKVDFSKIQSHLNFNTLVSLDRAIQEIDMNIKKSSLAELNLSKFHNVSIIKDLLLKTTLINSQISL